MADYFGAERSDSLWRYNVRQRKSGRRPMTFVRSLSVVTAYASIVFVGAIVLGLF
jgi:hypothetical protein